MKYKVELWKYSTLNTAAWEKKLNKRASQGWCFQSMSFIPPQIALFKKTESKKQYTVDVYRSKADGYAYEEDLAAYVNFYQQLGWELVYNDRDGYYIFEADKGTDMPPAYQSEEERRIQSRIHMGIRNDVYLLFYIAFWTALWAMSGTIPQFLSSGILFPIIVLVLLTFARSTINIAYVKGRSSTKLIKAQDFLNRLFGGFIYILIAYSTFLTVKMIVLGEFSKAWNFSVGELYYRLLLILVPMTVPLFLLGETVTLIAKKPYLGDIFYIMALLGAVGVFIV